MHQSGAPKCLIRKGLLIMAGLKLPRRLPRRAGKDVHFSQSGDVLAILYQPKGSGTRDLRPDRLFKVASTWKSSTSR